MHIWEDQVHIWDGTEVCGPLVAHLGRHDSHLGRQMRIWDDIFYIWDDTEVRGPFVAYMGRHNCCSPHLVGHTVHVGRQNHPCFC